ncbi:hypothetical protein GCM10007301_54530 [Azorhizobium oxalatiphilum]|uniref:Uncharacterized protein n=1 Tax=Azorhizobium oxalatiphilum TaxID=980631 RepID=A0A917CG37_9HYPH|nr:hypothetical protein GCM10007301_54530 [Azorhizobium oxalatiphilum]
MMRDGRSATMRGHFSGSARAGAAARSMLHSESKANRACPGGIRTGRRLRKLTGEFF